MRKVGFGVIGCGVISTAYLKAAQRFANLELRAVGLEQVAGVAKERRVVGVAAQAAADTEDPHRATPALTAAARR